MLKLDSCYPLELSEEGLYLEPGPAEEGSFLRLNMHHHVIQIYARRSDGTHKVMFYSKSGFRHILSTQFSGFRPIALNFNEEVIALERASVFNIAAGEELAFLCAHLGNSKRAKEASERHAQRFYEELQESLSRFE